MYSRQNGPGVGSDQGQIPSAIHLVYGDGFMCYLSLVASTGRLAKCTPAHVCACAFVGIHVCMCVCMYLYVHTCVCMYVFMCAYMCACIYLCVHTCVYVCMYVCIHVCMYVCFYVCVHVCVCASMHAHVHCVLFILCRFKSTKSYMYMQAISVFICRSTLTGCVLNTYGYAHRPALLKK